MIVMKKSTKFKKTVSLTLVLILTGMLFNIPSRVNAAVAGQERKIESLVGQTDTPVGPSDFYTLETDGYVNICLIKEDGSVETIYPQSGDNGQKKFYGIIPTSGDDAPRVGLISGNSNAASEERGAVLGNYFSKLLPESGFEYFVNVTRVSGSEVSDVEDATGSSNSTGGSGIPEDIYNISITAVPTFYVVFDLDEFGVAVNTTKYTRNLFNDTISALEDQFGSNLECWYIENTEMFDPDNLTFDMLADYTAIPIHIKAKKVVSPIKSFYIPDTPYGQTIKPSLSVNPPYVTSGAKISFYAGDKEVLIESGQSQVVPKDVGTYTAYVTVRKDSPDSGDFATARCTFKIVKANGSGKVTMDSYIFGGAPKKPVAASSTNDAATAVYSYKAAGAPDSSYSSAVPTAVGSYVVKATFPENKNYNSCFATADFKISYLPSDKSMYILDGNANEEGWYSDKVFIKPAPGYEISLNNRNSFSTGSIELNDLFPNAYFYIKKSATGEQTDMIMQNDCKIDMTAPQFTGWQADTRFFADESGKFAVQLKEKNVKKIYVDEKEITNFNSVGENQTFTIDAPIKPTTFKVKVVDMAGNETEKDFEIAPDWMESGVVKEGKLYFEDETEYSFPEGSWDIGDGITYAEGKFYACNEGEYNCAKN